MSEYQINNSNQGQAQRVTPSMRSLASKNQQEPRTTALDAPSDPAPVFERADYLRRELMKKALVEQAKAAHPDKLMKMQEILKSDPLYPAKHSMELARALLSSKAENNDNPLMDV